MNLKQMKQMEICRRVLERSRRHEHIGDSSLFPEHLSTCVQSADGDKRHRSIRAPFSVGDEWSRLQPNIGLRVRL